MEKKIRALLNLAATAGVKAPTPLIMIWALTDALRRQGVIGEAAIVESLDRLQSAPNVPAAVFAGAEQAKTLFDFALLAALFPDTPDTHPSDG